MKIVIDIDNLTGEYIQGIKDFNCGDRLVNEMFEAIHNGTVLPKEHGDLIDREELKISYETSLKQALRNNDRGIDLSKAADIPCERFNQFIDKVPTVIPAANGE